MVCSGWIARRSAGVLSRRRGRRTAVDLHIDESDKAEGRSGTYRIRTELDLSVMILSPGKS